MKKIILAVASVLALGMLVSCKQEISGNLTVTDLQYNAYQATTETYYYKAEGKVTTVTTQKVTTKTSATGSETGVGKTVTTYVDTVGSDNVVTLTVSKNPTTNVTTYTFGIPAFDRTTTREYTPEGGTTTTTYFTPTTTTASTKTITKIGTTYYYTDYNGDQVALSDFDPTASTLDFSKITDAGSTGTTYTGYDKTSSGETYTTKTVSTTVPTLALKYTKL